MRGHMRREHEHYGRQGQHQRHPALAALVAEAAKNRVAYRARQKDRAEEDSGPLRVIAVRLLKEQRAEAAHARAGKVAQAEGKSAKEEEKP